MEYFNKSPRIGTFIPTEKAVNVNSTIFGSPNMTNEKTVVMRLGKSHTLANLQLNSHALAELNQIRPSFNLHN
jgi:hypothetical protein